MAIEKEVLEFINTTGAEKVALSDYRGNIFRLNGHLLLIKISRTNKPFWGLPAHIVNALIKGELKFAVVFLVNANEGWVYQQQDVANMINRGTWRMDTKKQYKINPPMQDRFSFSSCQHFANILNSQLLS